MVDSKRELQFKSWARNAKGIRGRYHGGRRPSSDDSLHSPTVIPPSALDKPSFMKRYHCRRKRWGVTARSPMMVMLRDTQFVECRWWSDGWTVKTVVTWRSSASMIPAPGLERRGHCCPGLAVLASPSASLGWGTWPHTGEGGGGGGGNSTCLLSSSCVWSGRTASWSADTNIHCSFYLSFNFIDLICYLRGKEEESKDSRPK